MADKKISQQTEHITAILGVDLLPLVANVALTPANFKVQIKNFFSQVQIDFPATTFSCLKMSGLVSVNAVAATLVAGELALIANSSIGVTVRDRIGLIVRNEIQNGNSNVTGQMWGAHIKLDTGNSNCVSANTYGLVIEHTLDANVASARLVSPRAYLAIKEAAGASGNTTLYLMDVGAQGNTVSANTSTGNATVVFAKATDTTISHKLKVRINGTDYWVALTAGV